MENKNYFFTNKRRERHDDNKWTTKNDKKVNHFDR